MAVCEDAGLQLLPEISRPKCNLQKQAENLKT